MGEALGLGLGLYFILYWPIRRGIGEAGARIVSAMAMTSVGRMGEALGFGAVYFIL